MQSPDTEQQIKRLVRKANLLALLCFPVVLWQAWRLNHQVLRVPEAKGLSGHVDGIKPALRLLVIGESTSAGVGVEHNEDGLAGHLARALADEHKRSVHWRVIGLNGYTAGETLRKLCPQVAGGSADLVVIVHGFNDTVGWTSPAKWKKDIRKIVSILDTRLHRPDFVLTGIPPFRYFPSLPEPTRSILALRADALELSSKQLADGIRNLKYAELEALPGAEYYCIDGFHPSEQGYGLWARKLVDNYL